jgi:phage terminase large subunit-like protein
VAQMAGNNKVFIVDGEWNEPFLHESGAFGIKGVHDDRIDAVSGAFHQLERMELLANDSEIEQEYNKRDHGWE